MDLIVRDYVRSWHDSLSNDENRVAQIRLLLNQSVMELNRRIHSVDANVLIGDVVALARTHVIAVNDATRVFSMCNVASDSMITSSRSVSLGQHFRATLTGRLLQADQHSLPSSTRIASLGKAIPKKGLEWLCI
jgi:hypothetical protein